MRPATASGVIDRPREQVFDYLADVANHAEFIDHFTSDFRLERLESRGEGAAARFRLAFPFRSNWVELVLVELDRPYRLVLEGATGRIGRVPVRAEYRLTPHDEGMTRVELTVSSAPTNRIDRIREALSARPWLLRNCRRAVARMGAVLEQDEPSMRPALAVPRSL
jgi:uncharacterized protein YndB with AHSA1/START domain